jgi:hypothetical protein
LLFLAKAPVALYTIYGLHSLDLFQMHEVKQKKIELIAPEVPAPPTPHTVMTTFVIRPNFIIFANAYKSKRISSRWSMQKNALERIEGSKNMLKGGMKK